MVPSQHSALRGAFEWIAVIAIALVATFLIRSFVVEPFVVPTGSMESTIEIGDQILAQKVSLELGQPVKPPSPLNSAGRVYCAYSSSPPSSAVENDSSTLLISSPRAPGIRRTTASATTIAGSSPPVST